jgi:hypothetical protein
MIHITASDTDSEEIAILKDLYPELSHDKLLETKERLDGYFEVVLSILSRNHPQERLTHATQLPSMSSKVDSTLKHNKQNT